jgi:hypothetical protein
VASGLFKVAAKLHLSSLSAKDLEYEIERLGVEDPNFSNFNIGELQEKWKHYKFLFPWLVSLGADAGAWTIGNSLVISFHFFKSFIEHLIVLSTACKFSSHDDPKIFT